MRITLSDTGKRFNRDWIFRHLSLVFASGGSYAITGPNGSGKSTLLQVIAGAITPSEGTISYSAQEKELEADQAYRRLSIAAPYLEVIEEMTLNEFLHFHQTFKPLKLPVEQVVSLVGLDGATGKQIRYFSSGMKQRVKLAQAIFSHTDTLLLDEPCSNLDDQGTGMYHRLIEEYCQDRLVIVSSNDPQEYGFCREVVEMKDFKI